MSEVKTPMTVGQLIERLSREDPSTPVMAEYGADCWSGPVTEDSVVADVADLIAPFEYEPMLSHRSAPKVIQHPGMWEVRSGDEPSRPALETRACVVLRL